MRTYELRARMTDHVRINVDANTLEEVHQADALDHLAAAFVLEAVLRPEVDDIGGYFAQLFIILVGYRAS